MDNLRKQREPGMVESSSGMKMTAVPAVAVAPRLRPVAPSVPPAVAAL